MKSPLLLLVAGLNAFPTSSERLGFLAPENCFEFRVDCGPMDEKMCNGVKKTANDVGTLIGSQLLFKAPIIVQIFVSPVPMKVAMTIETNSFLAQRNGMKRHVYFTGLVKQSTTVPTSIDYKHDLMIILAPNRFIGLEVIKSRSHLEYLDEHLAQDLTAALGLSSSVSQYLPLVTLPGLPKSKRVCFEYLAGDKIQCLPLVGTELDSLLLLNEEFQQLGDHEPVTLDESISKLLQNISSKDIPFTELYSLMNAVEKPLKLSTPSNNITLDTKSAGESQSFKVGFDEVQYHDSPEFLMANKQYGKKSLLQRMSDLNVTNLYGPKTLDVLQFIGYSTVENTKDNVFTESQQGTYWL